MCAMHFWVTGSLINMFVSIHARHLSHRPLVCLLVLHFLFVLPFCWKKRLGPSASVVLPGGRNCTIAQSARRRICSVTQGAFKKRREKKSPASLLSFPYLFNTALNHPLTLSVGPPSIPCLFLLYSISLIPLRLPASLFG